jgi:hypothetical protein
MFVPPNVVREVATDPDILPALYVGAQAMPEDSGLEASGMDNRHGVRALAAPERSGEQCESAKFA